MRKLIFTSAILILTAGCSSNENMETQAVEQLYAELKKHKDFESDLTESTLIAFFKNVGVSELRSGKQSEQEYLFENFECDCRDKILLRYSKENNRFELNIHEQYFEKDVDWCPETSYFFSFQLHDNQVENVKLEQIAG